jgi:exopolysaccharide biosynthesis polyprenyl glycosylphosphotransferase
MAPPDTTALSSPVPAVLPIRDVSKGGLLLSLAPEPQIDLRPGAEPATLRERDPRREVARRDAIFRRSLGFADVVAAAFAVLLCVSVFGHDHLRPLALLALPLVVLAGKAQGIYDRDELLINKTTIDQAPQLFQLATLYALLFFLLQDGFIAGHLGTMQLLVLWGAMFILTLLARGAGRAFARLVTSAERCLFVGSERSCERLRGKLAGMGGRAVIVGHMSLGDARDDVAAAAAAATLHQLVADLRVHRVVIEPSEPLPQATLDFVREAKATGARVSLLPRILEVVGSSIEVDDLQGLTLLGVRRFGLSRSSAFLKRSFDAVGAGLGLAASAPLLALIAVAVRLDSRGPAIYRQTRVGRDGRPFTMWKFRTMVEGADALKPTLYALNEAEGLFKIADDPRVTRVGRWLRRFSLDELPQLVNVLRGEMSLVGPRPLVSDDDARITGLDRRRLHLTPGMTGHWQILGSARVPLPEMVKLDYLYVAGWSLWSDAKILLRTVPYVLARRGM